MNSEEANIANKKTQTSDKTKKMVFTALSAAIICILGPLTIPLPISPVPISLVIFGIYIAVYVCGRKMGTAACIIYLLIGFAGVPVFASFTAGAGKLLGPTGGYMIGYVFTAFISGFFIDRFEHKIYMHIVGMILGTLVCYAFGTAWLAYQAGMTFTAALWAGVIPFIPADICKIIAALIIGPQLRKAVRKLAVF